MHHRLLLLAAALSVLACGGPGKIEGTIAGRTLEVKSAAMVEYVTPQGTERFIALSDQPDICSVIKANRTAKSANQLNITLKPIVNGTPTTLSTGDYTVGTPPEFGTGKYASARIATTDANCREQVPVDQRDAKSGFVTVTSLDNAKHISGTFDLTMTSHVTGSFNADWCPVSASQTPPQCQ